MQTQSAAEPVTKRVAVASGSSWLPILLIGLAFAVLWFVCCRYLSAEWAFNEQYNYGWFVPFFAAYLFWLRWEDRPEPFPMSGDGSTDGQAPSHPKLGTARRPFLHQAIAIALIVVAALLLLPLRVFEIGSADWRPLGWVHMAAAATITLSIFYLLGGASWLRHFSFPILFLFVAVPWITPIEEPIVQGLMRVIAASAAETLSLFGFPAEVQGNLIRLPSGLVGVNEACSGVRSLQTSLTIGLLFGELKRLKLVPRVVLVASAIAIAIFANFLRATLLVWIAATRSLAAVKQWHDAAGYAIVVLVFLGTMWLAARWKSPSSSTRKRHWRLTIPRIVIGIAAAILAWAVAVEIGAEFWYRIHERNMVARAGWSVRWPEGAPGYHEIKIESEARNILRFDSGREVTWNSPRDSTFPASVDFLFFLRWNPGSGTILRARAHRPDICLPAAGWKQVGSDQIRNFEVAPGRSLPFHRFEFVTQNNRVHATAYFTLHEDAAHETENGGDADAGLYSNWDLADRWRVVRNGIRNRGQQVLEVIIANAASADQALSDQQFAGLLPKLIVPQNQN